MTEHTYIPGFGSIGARLMILTECPTADDVAAGRLYSKANTLKSVLMEAGINTSECWMTAVSKYYVPPNDTKKKIPFAIRAKNHGVDVHEQIEELRSEINQIKPNCILAIGKTALWTLSGNVDISSRRGSISFGMGHKFVATYNPDHLNWNALDVEFRGYWNRQIIAFDFRRAKEQSAFPELNRPLRNLFIAKSSYQVEEFFKRYPVDKKPVMWTDIESDGKCIPVCIGVAFTPSHAMTIPLWNHDEISEMHDSEIARCWQLAAEELWKRDIGGQNFNYDRDKLKRIGFAIRYLRHDNMLLAQAINPELPKGQAFNTSLYTEEPFYKDDGMYKGKIEDLLMGCARDAAVSCEVHENGYKDLIEIGQQDFYEQFLMKLPDPYHDMECQGFRVDTEERDKLVRKYVEWDERLRYELFLKTGTDINVNSPKQIASLLFDNLKLPYRKGTGEEEITSLLNLQTLKNEDHRKILELILEDRRVRKSISTYLMALPDFDGRMRTTYFPCLDTGRSSTGQQDPPIRPSIEVLDENGKKKKKVLGVAFQTMTKHGDVGADIRGMYVPDNNEEEEIFIQADSAQAEARVVFLLANDHQALHDIDNHDYHALTASWFFGGSESDYSKKTLGYEHPIRFVGKTLRHAGHLGAGKKRAAISVNTDARKFKIDISILERDAERALKIFHTKQPKIQQVFQAGIEAVIKKSRILVAPAPFGFNLEYGGRRTFYDRFGEELMRQAFSYIPQRTVSDNTKGALIRIRERIPGIKCVMEAHDSLLFSVPVRLKEHCIAIIKQEFERPIDFSRCSLPRGILIIPCDVETGTNYRDFKKFKDIPIIGRQKAFIATRPLTPTEQFALDPVLKDTELDTKVYNNMKINNEWIVGK